MECDTISQVKYSNVKVTPPMLFYGQVKLLIMKTDDRLALITRFIRITRNVRNAEFSEVTELLK